MGCGIRHVTSLEYRPTANGLAEGFVQSLKNALCAMTNSTRLTLADKSCTTSNLHIQEQNTTHSH